MVILAGGFGTWGKTKGGSRVFVTAAVRDVLDVSKEDVKNGALTEQDLSEAKAKVEANRSNLKAKSIKEETTPSKKRTQPQKKSLDDLLSEFEDKATIRVGSVHSVHNLPEKERKAMIEARDGYEGAKLTDKGTLMYLFRDYLKENSEDIPITPEIRKAAEAIKANGGRNWEPVLVKEKGEDNYEVVGNRAQLQAAKLAGVNRVWSIIVEDDFAGSLKPIDHAPLAIKMKPKTDLLNADGSRRGSRLTDIGTQMRIVNDYIMTPLPKPNKQIKEMAKKIKKSGRNFEPVLLKEVGEDRYEVVANADILAASKLAGFKRTWSVIVDAPN